MLVTRDLKGYSIPKPLSKRGLNRPEMHGKLIKTEERQQHRLGKSELPLHISIVTCSEQKELSLDKILSTK